MPPAFDSIVVGAGVVGLATARALAATGRSVLVLEAAPAIGAGTSSRNSEVIHAGIYYPKDSLKAGLCVAGRERLYAWCRQRGIAHRRLGKLIVATDPQQVHALETCRAQALANGVDDLLWLTAGQVAGLEPEVRCVAALLSPSTGIVDGHGFMLSLQADLEQSGGMVVLRSRVTAVRSSRGGFEVDVDGGPGASCRELVNSAGLQATDLARRIEGLAVDSIPRLHLAAGQYYSLSGPAPFHRLIYPVAQKSGLGIHVTLDLAGRVRFGPDVKWVDAVDYRFDESRKEAFVGAIRRYYPGLDAARLEPAYVGLRPRIHGPEEEPADFLIQSAAGHGVPGLVNLYGIESPGLTASLAIARHIAGILG